MGKLKPKTTSSASIDDVLSSIREAIHEETARDAKQRPRGAAAASPANRSASLTSPAASRSRDTAARETSVSGSMRELRVNLQPARQSDKSGTVTTRSEDFLTLKNKVASLRQDQRAATQTTAQATGGFAGIMGGDMRLEEALSRMNTAGQRQRDNNPLPPAGGPAYVANEPEQVLPQMRASLDDGDYQTLRSPVEPAPPAPEPAVPPAAYPQVMEPQPAAPAMQPVQAQPAIEPVQQILAEETSPPPAAEYTQLPVHPPSPPVMSPDSMAAAASAFDRLAEEMFNKTVGGSQALEQSVQDMIRPMLKKWLDENLPALAERLVREEIERVARRGGR